MNGEVAESVKNGPILLVMAAGMGSRYGGLKQMVPVGPSGETLLDYSVFDAVRAGFSKVVFVVRRQFKEDFQKKIGAKFASRIEVAYAEQETDGLEEGYGITINREKPLGTGHAVICAEPYLNGPFAVINGDDFYGRESFLVLGNALRESSVEGHVDRSYMVGFVLDKTLSENGCVSRGVCECGEADYLVSIEECTSIKRTERGIENVAAGKERQFTGKEWVSMNMWGFRASISEYIRPLFHRFLRAFEHDPQAEFYIPNCVDQLVRDEQLRVLVMGTSETWLGLTYAEDRAKVVREVAGLVKADRYPKSLWDGGLE